MEIVNSKDGSLQHKSPHVYSTIIDNSAVAQPEIGFSGTYMFVPCITEKGESGKLKTYTGSTAYSDMLRIHGAPNAKKYGLPYSGAIMHVSKGGSVALLPMKAPGATYAHTAVTMTVSRNVTATDTGRLKHEEKIGWVVALEAGDVMLEVKMSDEYSAVTTKYIPKSIVDFILKNMGESTRTQLGIGNISALPSDEHAANVILAKLPLGTLFIKEQFQKDTDSTRVSLFTTNLQPGSEELATFKDIHSRLGLSDEHLIELNKKLANMWKPAYLPAVQITFDQVDVTDLGANTDLLVKNNGITSWDMLIKGIQATSKGNLQDPLVPASTLNSSFKHTIPLLWGIHTGKGVYGNNYGINFVNTSGKVDGERPLMVSTIWNLKENTLVPDSRKNVSFNNDSINGDPLLIDSAYSSPFFKGEFKFETASNEALDSFGEILQIFFNTAFKNEDGEFNIPYYQGSSLKYAKPLLTDSMGRPSYGVAGDLVIDSMKKAIDDLEEPDDSNYHRMSKVDFTRINKLPGVVLSSGITDYRFIGGHEGEFEYMREFDWDFNFGDTYKNGKLVKRFKNDPKFMAYKNKYGNTKILHKLFVDAFSGTTDSGVNSLYSNPADYVIDFDYPLSVKTAMYNFGVKNRDDIQLLFNTTTTAKSADNSIADKMITNFESRNVQYYAGNFDWIDPYSNRSVRVPQTFLMISNLLRFYENGFDQALAGVHRGVIEGAVPNSGLGYGSMTLAENDKLYENYVNILNVYENGTIYIDSQISNYLVGTGKVSSLNEFHNNAIVNRIIKTCYRKLQPYKHMLTTEEAVASVESAINRELQKYVGKVASLSYSAKFVDSYNKAIGLITHGISVEFNNTVKYHHVELTALPIK